MTTSNAMKELQPMSAPATETADTERTWPAILGLTVTAALWAGNALVARATADAIPPVALAFWRWSLPLLYLLPYTLWVWRRYREVILAHRRRLLGLSIFSITTYNTLLYLAAQYTTAINITLVSASMPLITVALSALLLGSLPTRAQGLGALLALSGVLIILTRTEWQVLAQLSFNPGDLIMLVSILSWSIYSVLLKRWPVPIPGFPLLCLLITIGAPLILPFYLWEWAFKGGFELTTNTLGALAYVGVLPSVVAYFLWNRGVARIGPANAALFFYLIPVFAAVIAVPVLGEQLAGYHLAGAGFILLGLYLASRRQRARQY
ncbi:DMT family transporter [Marinobacteraceae bacterium S3BR75-40.1]